MKLNNHTQSSYSRPLPKAATARQHHKIAPALAGGTAASLLLSSTALAADKVVCTPIPNSTSMICEGLPTGAVASGGVPPAASTGHFAMGALIGGGIGLLLSSIPLPDNDPPSAGGRIMFTAVCAGIGGAIGYFI